MPQLSDTSLMPFGKHKGKRMIDVPAKYLLWLYENGLGAGDVKDYITNNIDGLRKESGSKR